MPKINKCVVLAVVAFVWGASDIAAQPTQEIPSAPLDGAQMLEQHIIAPPNTPSVSSSAEQPLRGLCDADVRTKSTGEACEAAMLDLIKSFAKVSIASNQTTSHSFDARFQFDKQVQAHSLRALEDQAERSEILFWTAMVTVALGLLAAGFQFLQSWKSGQHATPTEFAIGEKQISIKTAWIGVVLLAMSMGFLTLYLTLVYPIVPI